MQKDTRPSDILIHLGDICWKNDAYWNACFNSIQCKSKILVLGNYDKKSIFWYLEYWDAVVKTFTIKRHGKTILFSHKPLPDTGYDINIHGHLHNSNHHDGEWIRNEKQTPVMMEHHYKPHNITDLI